MMRSVLADMALAVEGAVALVMRLARAFDHATSDAREAAYARVLTPAVKFWVCKTAPTLIAEAMECLGGNGYVEESLMPRLYREAPVNAIWEGSGNVMALDVLRAFERDGEAAKTSLEDLARQTVGLPGCADAGTLIAGIRAEANARIAVGRLALLAATAALTTCAPATVAETFARAHLGRRGMPLYGSAKLDAATEELLLQRALPHLQE
jgi:putative acyl-CoA dehydrogenase